MNRRTDLGLDIFIAFIDQEKAFDKVDWKIMMKIFKKVRLDYRDRRNLPALQEIRDKH